MAEISEKTKAKLKRLELFAKNPSLASQQQIEAIIDGMEDIKNSLPPAFMGVLKGDKGDKGDPGENGRTPTEEELIKLIQPLIPNPIPGESGKTPTSEELLDLIKPLIPQIKNVEPPSDEYILDLIKKVMPVVQKSEEIMSDTAEQIVEKINELPTDSNEFKIDFSHIKNTPELSEAGRSGIGGVRNIQVLDESTILTKTLRKIKFAGTGVQASLVDGVVVVTISGVSSNESIAELLTNSGDDVNFTFANTPTSVSVVWDESTGQVYTPGVSKDYTYSGSTLTFNSAQTSRNIRANYVY